MVYFLYHDQIKDEKAIRDDDQLSVQSLDHSAVFSIPDDASSGSQSSTNELLSAVDELTNVLANDEVLKPLFRAALHAESIGGDRFESRFRHLLVLCSQELDKEAQQELQNDLVWLVRVYATYVTNRLRAMHEDPGYDSKAKEMGNLETQRDRRSRPEIVAQVNSYMSFPTTISQDSVSPTAPGSSTPVDSAVRCRICSIEFSGSRQNATANLKRHLRTSHRHNRVAGLKCPMPKCQAKQNMRADNLGLHLRNFHKISSIAERESIIQVSKQHARDRALLSPNDESRPSARAVENGDSASYTKEPDSDQMDLPSLINLREFFLSTIAFKNLRTNFEQFVQPAETTSVPPDIAQRVRFAQDNVSSGFCAEGDQTTSSRLYNALSLQVRKVQTLHTSIRSRVFDLSSPFRSWGSRISESYIRRSEPLIDRDKVRIRWECRCGRKLWDDFRELRPGAAEDLRRCLGSYEKTMSAQATPNLQQTHNLWPLNVNSAASVLRRPLSSDAGAPGHLSAVDTEIPLPAPSCAEAKFLLLCFRKPRDTLRLYHLSVEHIKTDFQLFQLLQRTYRAYQGLSGRVLSPRKIKSIVFRKARHLIRCCDAIKHIDNNLQLERHPRERVVIRSSPDIVPERTNPDVCHKDHVSKCDTEYDIDPVPPDLDPYIGPNGLEHLLNHPHEAEELGNNLPVQDVWLKRFPKKEKSKLTVCPPYQYGIGWGVEFEEAWNFSWVLKGTLIVCVLAASVFLVCWWSIRGDVQGATGMAALLVSYCVLLITMFSAFAIA